MMRAMILALALLSAVPAGANEAPPPATRPSTQPVPLGQRLSAEEMLKQMLQPTTQTAAPLEPVANGGGGIINHNTGANAVAPGAPQLKLLPEGTLITGEIGRLTRTQDGTGWEFMPVADGKDMLDPPFRVLPNKNLTNMINASLLSHDDIRFRVSGELTEFDNRNYILIERVVKVIQAPLKAQ